MNCPDTLLKSTNINIIVKSKKKSPKAWESDSERYWTAITIYSLNVSVSVAKSKPVGRVKRLLFPPGRVVKLISLFEQPH